MVIYDQKTLKDITMVAVSILKRNFFYEDDIIARFINDYTNMIGDELNYFTLHADTDILDELLNVKIARIHFTCYLASVNLRHIFISKLNFSDQELFAFESILPKYIGAKPYETESRYKRENN